MAAKVLNGEWFVAYSRKLGICSEALYVHSGRADSVQ